ncbi:acyltransferase family protein [Ostreibacterium oceani]|uniref:Acyltransferase 3 domain-containing protein n=1 Tax=Ostreibacterium oceani TaxID=2654998 RepID=A0A6N7EWT8_9GAMM|nr:hypothetical protein [Ostreibacterium oceani]MPV87011.1 hypothetical protein [Ostreibacterium oceani]
MQHLYRCTYKWNSGSIIIFFVVQVSRHPIAESIATFSGLQFIGKCSYSLYLIHIPVLRSLKQFYDTEGVPPNIICVFAAIIIATLVLHYTVFNPAKNKQLPA